ncbi:hypothetical protein ACFOEQ_05250 [Chryseobacterium arachidis]|uniref:hypothetical protein n=1 Tax=Chryseobacterium arachidis TaxID=1416778 RepID=UPI00360C20AB
MNPRLVTNYKKTGSSAPLQNSSAGILTSYPTEVLTEKDQKYTEQKILIPEFSVPGILAKPELEGLTFHFMAFPTIFEYADFRLIDGNKYGFLGFNGKPVSEFTPEFITECIEAMQTHFEEIDQPSTYSEDHGSDASDDGEDIRLLTGNVKWHLNTYLRKTTEEENKILDQLEAEGKLEYENFDEDFNYTTNYDLPVFKDENGNTLEFICRLNAPHFPGSHYLFYSKETKLVRQFSQFSKRKKREICLTETDEPNAYKNVAEVLSDPAKVLADRSYFDKKIILPKYSFPGAIISKKYEDLVFHLVVTPIFNESIDFRLTDDNKYELLRFDDKTPDDFTPDFIKRCKIEMEEDFEMMDEEPRYFFNVDEASDKSLESCDLELIVGTEPDWAQATLMREKTEEEIQSDYDAANMMTHKAPFHDDEYVTDYDLPEFKDENGETMEFVTSLYSGDFRKLFPLLFA